MKRKQLLMVMTVLVLVSASACGRADGPAAGEEALLAEGEPGMTTSPATPSLEPVEATDLPDFLEHLDRITLLTPTSGSGPRPVLAWEAADGADRYGVYLYDSKGELYWSWQGRETEIPVGGRPRLVDEAPGPRVAEGMTWTVIGLNADQLPVAAGGPQPIAP